jgi:hypothetical protein
MKPLLPVFFLLLSGCTTLHSVSLTSVPAQRSQKISAQREKFIVMGFNFENDYVADVAADLRRQCPQGFISGVLTKHETVNYFLYLFWKQRVTSEAFCSNKAVSKADRPRRPSSSEDVAADESDDGVPQ